ncbi:substrate-binding domain-containing protein [Anaerorhabdus sp.]|uniref:substrate-binding domain-containing protein n=1 Tax=Anaerorhabdus sp. TaxID=1872524 RepID=UPI002B21258C|nr:substrate-binding domain-containing protein [Anaerorhabdus sp.]MEA4874237.1 substrate-binding domain-containing protein [Anaerorhabdus sp.]
MKKILSLILASMLIAGCSSAPANTEGTATPTAATTGGSTINVYTRDSSSGTREAFQSAIGLEELTANAIEVSSNGDMATKVGADVNGIGYVSLSTDFEASGLTPLNYEGVTPTVETVLDGTYSMQRPFAYVTRAAGDFGSDEKEQLVVAFIDFITNSTEGMAVVESQHGIVDATKGTPWAELAKNHPIVAQDNSGITLVTAGSTSVSKTLQAALEAFQPMAGNFQFTMNQTGSGDGYKRVLGEEKDGANAADIGFASRNFKAEEDVTTSMASGVYCIDAVVAVVNKANSLTDITAAQLNDIFSGNVTDYSAIK